MVHLGWETGAGPEAVTAIPRLIIAPLRPHTTRIQITTGLGMRTFNIFAGIIFGIIGGKKNQE